MKLLEYRSLPAHALRGLIDRRYGIETMEAVSKKELGLGPEQVQYVAVPWLLLGRLLRLLELSSDDVFVDFGSG